MEPPRAVHHFLRGLATSCHPEHASARGSGPGTSARLVRDRDTRIVRHRPRVDGENRLVRGAQPANLQNSFSSRHAIDFSNVSSQSFASRIVFMDKIMIIGDYLMHLYLYMGSLYISVVTDIFINDFVKAVDKMVYISILINYDVKYGVCVCTYLSFVVLLFFWS